MQTSAMLSPKKVLIGTAILAGCIIVVLQVSAFPGQNPPGFRDTTPNQPAPGFLPPRAVDDQRFIQPSNQPMTSALTGAAGGAAASGGLSGGGSSGGFSGGGFSGFGGTGGGGFFFGAGRMARMGGMNQGQANHRFYGSFNFGGFKGYGFGGGDMSTWRATQVPAMDGAAQHTDK